MHQIWGLQNKDNTNRRRMVVSVRHIGIALGVGSDTLKGIVRHHLPQQHKLSRKEINIDHSYDGSKLFTTIPGACKVIFGSTHPDRHDVIEFLVEIIYKISSGKHKKQGIWCLMIVYLQLNIVDNTSILCLN